MRLESAILLTLSFVIPSGVRAATGTEAASFLEIPVGAEPAAMGGAYSALATNAYAPIYNPAGLGFAPSTQLAGQHLAYLESIHFEYMSFIHPLEQGKALGVSMQYLGSGDMAQTNDSGQQTGNFSSHFAAYTLAYGQELNDKLALGIAAKWINAKISDVGSNAYAADAGIMLRASEKLTLAGVMSNAGTKLTFLDDGGSLPLLGRLGAAYEVTPQLRLSADGIYRAYGLASGHVGAEWRPVPMVALRAGYRTDTTKELGVMAGVTAGMGLTLWGQEFSYAWLPMGDLGMTQYFSLLLKFGEEAREKRNLIQYHTIRSIRSVNRTTIKEGSGRDVLQETTVREEDPEYQQLMQLLSDNDHELFAHTLTSSVQAQ